MALALAKSWVVPKDTGPGPGFSCYFNSVQCYWVLKGFFTVLFYCIFSDYKTLLRIEDEVSVNCCVMSQRRCVFGCESKTDFAFRD